MKIGDIVISLCGHDMGEWYVVEQVLNEYVFLVDGKNKPIEKPKKKKSQTCFGNRAFCRIDGRKIVI